MSSLVLINEFRIKNKIIHMFKNYSLKQYAYATKSGDLYIVINCMTAFILSKSGTTFAALQSSGKVLCVNDGYMNLIVYCVIYQIGCDYKKHVIFRKSCKDSDSPLWFDMLVKDSFHSNAFS